MYNKSLEMNFVLDLLCVLKNYQNHAFFQLLEWYYPLRQAWHLSFMITVAEQRHWTAVIVSHVCMILCKELISHNICKELIGFS